jgi:hypothetical protein
MYLFVRTLTCVPARLAEATAFAVDIAGRASSITGLEMAAWQLEYGAPISTFTWTTTVGSHADIGAAGAALMADAGYVAAVGAAAELFAGPAEDTLANIVATAGDGGHRGDYASIVMAQCAMGRIADAMVWGVEMMQHVHGVTGRDSAFTRSIYGPWASVAWFSLAASLDEVESASAALAADSAYLAKVDTGADLFLPGSGVGRLSRRIA